MPCEACNENPNKKQMELLIVIGDAKKFAMETMENIFVYRNEQGYGYITETNFYKFNPGQFVECLTPKL